MRKLELLEWDHVQDTYYLGPKNKKVRVKLLEEPLVLKIRGKVPEEILSGAIHERAPRSAEAYLLARIGESRSTRYGVAYFKLPKGSPDKSISLSMQDLFKFLGRSKKSYQNYLRAIQDTESVA